MIEKDTVGTRDIPTPVPVELHAVELHAAEFHAIVIDVPPTRRKRR